MKLPVFYFIVFVTCMMTSLSCSRHINTADFEITSFSALTNTEFESQAEFGLIAIQADLEDAVINGIRIPTEKQCQGGKLGFTFTIKRHSGNDEKLYYKLYFQNTSYKFDDSHPLSGENFYGSWMESSVDFKPLHDFSDEIVISDSLIIMGNPRNEHIYFGASPLLEIVEAEKVKNQMELIRQNEEWYSSIIKKAKQENRALEKQLMLDAKWIINQERANLFSVNNRHWRNPRMGQYEFMLVVITESQYENLPDHQRNLSNRNENGDFVNPFGYFIHGEGSNQPDVQCSVAGRRLKVFAKYDLGSGIYVREPSDSLTDRTYYSRSCGDSERLFRRAHFGQYLAESSDGVLIQNVPVVENTSSSSFTAEKYYRLEKKYENSNSLRKSQVGISECPCKTAHSNSKRNEIVIANPGNSPDQTPKKENVGVFGRIGMTYGKWRAKIQFPAVINPQGVWNGITNAFRLVSQDPLASWNERRLCNHPVGYVPANAPSTEGSLLLSRPKDAFSRIDLEVLKESEFWPSASYSDSTRVISKRKELQDEVIMACSNWDLACHEPNNFILKAKRNVYEGHEFIHHRWNIWHQAVTTKQAIWRGDLLVSHFYYYEIEWTPSKIIWRVGPTPDQMRIICIMEESMTAIPNNQMLPSVTQEWHSQELWPMAPFNQSFIPFPSQDIVGRILEVSVE